jgi:hypothetical protein
VSHGPKHGVDALLDSVTTDEARPAERTDILQRLEALDAQRGKPPLTAPDVSDRQCR